ncbi:MAG: hypothetical protein QOF61_431 [Acidobacteriota bacterium]|jgi:hypothetical protein|nr:hypothetical protein [Acidobacteriota bacterium]
MNLIFAVLFSSLCLLNHGQPSHSRSASPLSDDHIQEIIKSLEPDNILRRSLERGERGDGVHRAWMDKMRQHNIKQSSAILRFSWKGETTVVKIKEVLLLQQYYRYDTQIKGGNLLRRAREDGLIQELREVILARAQAAVHELIKNIAQTARRDIRRAHGTLYLNLLDDETLPVLNQMPTVEW